MSRRRIMAALSVVTLASALAVVSQAPAAFAVDCAAAWRSTAVYTQGNRVSHAGANWVAQWWTQGEIPGNTGEWGVWRNRTPCTGGGGGNPQPPPPPPGPQPPGCNHPNWVAGQFYNAGAIVRYTNGQFYIAEHANPGYDPTISTWFWDPFNCGGGGNPPPPPPGPQPPPPPPGPGGFVVTEAQFNQMFPGRNPFYTYSGLTAALSSFPGFARTGTDTTRRREAAAFLANASHETGGLVHITEINKNNDLCDESQPYGCPAGTFAYYGRGPIQLSWNFNYKAAGDALGINLLGDPFRVERDAAVAWRTALWYWNTQTGPGTMTPHNAMVNGAGFGETIRSINGALECNGRNPAQVQSRINNYQRFVAILGTTAGNNLSC